MAKINDLTVDIATRMTIPRESVERALRLVNWYLQDHPDIKPNVQSVEKKGMIPYHEIVLGKE